MLEALIHRLPSAVRSTTPSPKRSKQRRARQLNDQQVDELTRAYQAGQTVYDLAA